jgi:hypothetical protein
MRQSGCSWASITRHIACGEACAEYLGVQDICPPMLLTHRPKTLRITESIDSTSATAERKYRLQNVHEASGLANLTTVIQSSGVENCAIGGK